MLVIVPDFGCAKWKMVNPNYTNVPLDISLGKLSSKKVVKIGLDSYLTDLAQKDVVHLKIDLKFDFWEQINYA